MKLTDFRKVSLPKELVDCPIIEAVLEVRFVPAIDEDAVYGSIFSSVKSKWSFLEKLPITEIPPFVRKGDPNLKAAVHYRLGKESLLLQIGPAVLSIVSRRPYVGSEKLFGEFDWVLDKVAEQDIVKEFTRIGVRYIDFFETNVFDGLLFDCSLGGLPISKTTTSIRTVIEGDTGFKLNLQLVGDAVQESSGKQGSVLDIDSVKEKVSTKSIAEIKEALKSGHLQQKQLFYALVKEDFLAKFKPVR